MTRAAYDRSMLRSYLRTAAAIFTAVGMAFVGEEKVTRDTFLNWRKSTPFIDRLLAIDRWQNEQQRMIALDLSSLLLPRTGRFFAAHATLTLSPDDKLAGATRDLGEAVAAVLDATGAKERVYA
jgi:hypothetical protein